MKAVVAAFNQEKTLVGAFSVILQTLVEPMDRFTTLLLIPGSASNRVGQCLEYASCYMAGGYGDGSCAEVLKSIIKYFYLDN